MPKIRIDIHRDFPCRPETLFGFLSEHESLGRLFRPGTSFERLCDGRHGRNTEGSARKITVLGLISFTETYTRVSAGSLLEYEVSGAAPIRNHRSTMTITRTPDGSHLHYTSAYDGKFPLAAFFITPGLKLVMRLAFRRLSGILKRTAEPPPLRRRPAQGRRMG